MSGLVNWCKKMAKGLFPLVDSKIFSPTRERRLLDAFIQDLEESGGRLDLSLRIQEQSLLQDQIDRSWENIRVLERIHRDIDGQFGRNLSIIDPQAVEPIIRSSRSFESRTIAIVGLLAGLLAVIGFELVRRSEGDGVLI